VQSGDTSPELSGAIRDSVKCREAWRGVFRNRRKNGGFCQADTMILPLVGAHGAVQNLIGIAEDITEKRRTHEQTVRAQKLEAVGLPAGGITHDFNTVLTTIIGAAHLAAMDAPVGSEITGEIEQINIAARRAQSPVRELLTCAAGTGAPPAHGPDRADRRSAAADAGLSPTIHRL
jgi:signal transduction histidine kinase